MSLAVAYGKPVQGGVKRANEIYTGEKAAKTRDETGC